MAINFYNQADNLLYEQPNSQFLGESRFRGTVAPNPQEIEEEKIIETFGIPNTEVFRNSNNNNFNNTQNNLGSMGNYQNIDFNEQYSYNPQAGMTDANDYGYGVADQDKGFFKETMNKINNTFRGSPVDKALGKGMDFGKTIGSGIISAASGVPFLGNALNYATRNMENRTLGAGIIDEYGNYFNEDDLNSQNALGGGYTDAARSSRRRTARIANMKERLAAGKKISDKNLAELEAQEAAQEAARQAAANKMQSENRQQETGGYQAGYGSDFMEGPSDAGRGNAPSDKGGSDSMGSFAEGGRVGYYFGGLAARGMKR